MHGEAKFRILAFLSMYESAALERTRPPVGEEGEDSDAPTEPLKYCVLMRLDTTRPRCLVEKKSPRQRFCRRFRGLGYFRRGVN